MVNEFSGDMLLYNLANNKYENPNVAVNNQGIVSGLQDAINTWKESHAAPIWPSVIYFTAEKDGKVFYFEQ